MLTKLVLISLLIGAKQILAATPYRTYQARVFDYAPAKENTQKETILRNVQNYVNLLDKPKDIDIVVFPEYGLTGVGVLDHPNLTDSIVKIPAPSSEPLCRKTGIHKVLEDLSCIIVQANAYAVINLLEEGEAGDIIYNTNVVFDRSGAIVAKYRKINLFDNEIKRLKAGTEKVTFTTDFGVEFGLITCFDILFKNPALDILDKRNVTDVIMTTAWFSRLPFYVSLGVQDGYAKKNGINFLVAGLSDPENGNGGSGFYLPGQYNRLYLPTAPTTQSKSTTMDVITSREPEKACNDMIDSRIGGTPPSINAFKTKIMNDYQSYTYHNILENENSDNRFEKESCKGKLCCKFDVKYDRSLADIVEVYKAVVSENACGIVACDDVTDISQCGSRSDNLKTAFFKNITISVKFDNKQVYQYMPVSANLDLMPIKYTYCESKDIVLTTTSQAGLVYFGFISSSENASTSVHANFGLLGLVAIITFLFKY